MWKHVSFGTLCLLAAGCSTPQESVASGGAALDRGAVVISQVYGGGGAFPESYVELFNKTSSSVGLDGLSLQAGDATGSFSSIGNFALSGSIPPNGYFLITMGGAVTNPTADMSGAGLTLGVAAGKVALAPSTADVTCGGTKRCGSADGLIDYIGYGLANDFEGTDKAPALSASTAAIRGTSGCADTDNNNKDFTAGAPAPRNSSTTFTCPAKPVDAGVEAGPVPTFNDPALGKESPFDAGVRRDASPDASGGGSGGSCTIGAIGGEAHGFALLGLLFAAVFAAARIRSRRR